jgi:TIR domain/CobQ/CobB/MinD/ParA nucleotide binding domain
MARGTIVTFYSYKGGVGRSFAMANVATILARWHFKVLCIDWDIEAPGLSYYFAPYLPGKGSRRGLVDMLAGFPDSQGPHLYWNRYTTTMHLPSVEPIDLISAGQRRDENYTLRVQALNWTVMYERGLGAALEQMCLEFREAYDFVLIDGRTGVTDFGGIITAQLPDILALLSTANNQSLEGAVGVAERAIRLRNELPFDRPRLLVLPVPSRFEESVEYETAKKWKDRYVERLGNFYKSWAVKDTPVRALIDHTTIPYVPYWSFGERLSALEEPTTSPSGINYNLETLAALLAHRLDRTDLLAENRDAFVDGARRLGARSSEGVSAVFISYGAKDRDFAARLRSALLERNITAIDDSDISRGEPFSEALDQAINRAHHMVLLIGPTGVESKSVDKAIRRFQRQSANEESRTRLLLPVLLPGTSPSAVPKNILNLQYGSASVWGSGMRALVSLLAYVSSSERALDIPVEPDSKRLVNEHRSC